MEVAHRDGVGRTAAALHLDCSKLKRLMEEAGMIAERPAPPAFVELTTSDATSLPEYTLELEGRNGKLRIHCRGIAAADLVSLSRALWNVAA
jgi:hypothetical protein